jgi:DNA-binding GntR family transcriptional regulator
MSRLKTANVPDLNALLTPQNHLMLAVEQAMLRGPEWARVAPSMADQIAVRMAGVITLGLVQAGQRLLEQDIAQVLKVSRAVVREALRILERERLVEFQPRRGAIVTAPDAAELNGIFTVRGALYAIMLRQEMEECPAELEQVLAEHLVRLRKGADESAEAFAVGSFLLNLAISDLCSNRLLAELLKSIALRTLRYVRLGRVANPKRIARSLQTWRTLHKAVADRDTDAVLTIAAERIADIRKASLQALDAATLNQRAPRS